jgi:CIC family chloride channel protein
MLSRIQDLLVNALAALQRTRVGSAGKWVLLASLIGLAGGFVGVGVDWLLEEVKEFALHRPAGIETEGLGEITSRSWLILVIPALGGLIAGWLVWKVAPETSGHGTEQVIHAFHEKGGRVRKRVIGVKGVASAVTIGTGGSAGMEGPVSQIGSGMGSALADLFRLSERERRVFLLSGASAGIGALFTAPLGGALFAPEVLYKKPEFEGDAIIPCIISSIVAFTTFKTITGKERKIELEQSLLDGLAFDDPRQLLVYLALALLCTVVATT